MSSHVALSPLDSHLSALEKWFSSAPKYDSPDQIKTLLQPILELQHNLRCKEKQITFFGAFKAGKSTLLNAIIGSEMLPSRVNRATGVVTKIGYASQPSASVTSHTSEGKIIKKPIPFDDLAEYILLDLSSGISKPPEGVEEVVLHIPLPLLQHNCILADTPGSMDTQALTERAYQEIEKSDLAVMVLSADKLLSETEKDTAGRVNELLNGNIVFIINRIGLVDTEEREEVLAWAKTTLKGLGNSLVGQPHIFVTDAKTSLQEKTNHAVQTTGISSLLKFEQWLEGALSTPIGEKIAFLSRLGILERHLSNAQILFQNQLAEAQTTVKNLTQAEAQASANQQTQRENGIIRDRLRLSSIKTQLDHFGETFFNSYTTKAEKLIVSDSEWQGKLNSCLHLALNSYCQSIYQGITSPILQTSIEVSICDLNPSIINPGIILTEDSSAASIGGWIGGTIGTLLEPGGGTIVGAGLGAWLGQSFFGVDIKQQALVSLRCSAHSILETIRVQAEQYIDRVDQLLIDFGKSYNSTSQPSLNLQAAQKNDKYYSSLVSWGDEFQNTINNIKMEIVI
ncbi:hypothetical protein C7B67_14245 [filamentous cyanobacterium Phorm 6]|nr:hypothetical protein C7B67_14245 [filamentous cyanobacterium Phorm 6]